tara:strand:- start:86 stop:1216 length:1131 start_codon:yes stop_codon:yes gene_type:complete
MFLILLAAGESKRLKTSTPKPFIKINNLTLLEHAHNAFKDFKEINRIVIVYNKKHKKYLKTLNLGNSLKIIGGKNRQESVYKGLKKIRKMKCKKVLIHDTARPNPSKKLIRTIINNLKKKHAVIPVIKVNDATKRINKNLIFKNIQRDSLCFSQTPQGFTFERLFEKHKENVNETLDDDSSLFTLCGERVSAINGEKTNLKITEKNDLHIFKSLKKGNTYSGIGFDVHKLVKKRKLYLGGLRIPYSFGLEGHSDADPVLHSLIDGLLGACKLGDIGKLFSNRNKKYKNIRSTILLSEVIKLIKSKNFLINNIDINIITQKPKIQKYSKKIIYNISKLCEISSKQINVKGKTTEKLGLVGKGQAIASEAIVSVIKYD